MVYFILCKGNDKIFFAFGECRVNLTFVAC